MAQRKYDSTVARIAGNIAAGLVTNDYQEGYHSAKWFAREAVAIARAIVAEVEHIESEMEPAP